jgi:hypothetical protein
MHSMHLLFSAAILLPLFAKASSGPLTGTCSPSALAMPINIRGISAKNTIISFHFYALATSLEVRPGSSATRPPLLVFDFSLWYLSANCCPRFALFPLGIFLLKSSSGQLLTLPATLPPTLPANRLSNYSASYSSSFSSSNLRMHASYLCMPATCASCPCMPATQMHARFSSV